MAVSKDLGLDKTAKALGLKRRFFGFESNRSLAARVVGELGKQNPMTQLLDGLAKAFEPRSCIGEEYQEIETPPYYLDNGIAVEFPGRWWLLKVWTYHYSDGTSEQVISKGYL